MSTHARPSGPRTPRPLQAAMEAVLLVMVALAPWAYGSEPPGFEFLLDAGIFLLVILWAVAMLFAGTASWRKCPVALCLAGLFLLGVWQITPLNKTLLGWLSPSTKQLYDQLLPAQRETLSGQEDTAAPAAAGRTLSVYPHATRVQLPRILALLLVFAIVRNNLGSTRVFTRLAMVALANGALLALFGFLQFFSSPSDVLYWMYPSQGRVFGPFIYRSHYACYINLCIGLGLGLLWSRRNALERANRYDDDSPAPPYPGASLSERLLSQLRLLHDPASLWICVALALMVSSVLFSLSRGGFLALVGAFAVCLLIKLRRSANVFRPGAILFCAALAIGLLGWFGLARIEARLATISGKTLQESRFTLWAGAWNLAVHFPIWGTGYGTYAYVDPMYRTNAEASELVVDHPHNDYLELFAEAGLAGLALGLLAIILVLRLGFRALRRDDAGGGLALGALFAFTALLIHSLGDFNVAVPAITLLAAVICAQLCASGASERARQPDVKPSGSIKYQLFGGRLGAVLGAAACVLLGLIVIGSGWKRHEVELLRLHAFRAGEQPGADGLEAKKSYLETALRLTPDDADLRTEIGETYADLYRAKTAATRQEQRLTQTYLLPGLENLIQARDLGPVLPGPHLGLALHSNEMLRAEPFDAYMARVQLLAPGDPAFWYYCGNKQLLHDRPESAWKSWRRCLELSDRYLPKIVERGVKLLGPEVFLTKVMPEAPDRLLSAAQRLRKNSDDTAVASPFLRKALQLLSAKGTSLTDKDLHAKALAHKCLGQTTDALADYRALLAREPFQADWRYELAQVLYEDGRLNEARTELLTVLATKPGHEQAYQLLRDVTKGLLRRKA